MAQIIRLHILLASFLILVYQCSLSFSAVAMGATEPRAPSTVPLPDLYEASIAELQDGLEKGLFTSVDLVKAYFARIEEVNLQGPILRAVIEMNPSALTQAAALDKERKLKGARSPLHGIPILLKDNIATMASDGNTHLSMLTTSQTLTAPRNARKKHRHEHDRRLVRAIQLHPPARCDSGSKTALGGRDPPRQGEPVRVGALRGNLASGWSGRGGQATCPYFPQADPSGSSAGSGIGTAIGLTAAALGSETDGSIVSPSSRNNLVGIKPTVGLTSRAGGERSIF
ncbi:hypothetical protein EW146_g124 [Bondarzewia mesenterica]|uniref:Amidase domain-containing protein n=1 Tax=Bondarzewia mesenterica TaxID=1095465 RepID=A0A4S4MA60_9AGAM|nr:hypothetical protein EW146_g124 [Bondarzewia mesenterica]